MLDMAIICFNQFYYVFVLLVLHLILDCVRCGCAVLQAVSFRLTVRRGSVSAPVILSKSALRVEARLAAVTI